MPMRTLEFGAEGKGKAGNPSERDGRLPEAEEIAR
jgi:hypothetical protein